jgi:signal transduction histidine kinase/CheY-like chemotaxis protein/HPt (histidine-containing phosphotransfer) domain-containing protein
MKRMDPFFHLPIAACVIDERGQLREWNMAFAELLFSVSGRIPGKGAGSPGLFELFGSPESGRHLLAALERGSLPSARVEFIVADVKGTPRYLAALAGPMEPDSGIYAAALFDETERRGREHSLIIEREEAERVSGARRRFLANMSHEIRTPIQTISAIAELIAETQLDREQEDYVGQIRFAAEILLGLVNDVLDSAKLEAGALALDDVEFDPAREVERAVDLLTLEAHRKGLDMLLDLDARLPKAIKGDPARFRQVIVNLAKNAVKFTDAGHVLVRVRAGEDELSVEVEDSGLGVPEELRPKLFSRFFQADESSTRSKGGTGLGLAISRELVERMGGSIGMEESPTGGSLFWFRIPLRGALPPKPRKMALAPQRVLVVDDYAPARALAASMLAESGYEPYEAEGGEQAIEALARAAGRGEAFPLCLIDMGMPGMDGWRLAAEIASRGLAIATKLILMIPEGRIGADAKMMLLKWFSAYVRKPLKRAALVDCLDALSSVEGELEPAEAEKPSAQQEPALSGKVLVVEDHPVNRELARAMLDSMGLRIELASDGEEAVWLATNSRPDIILMDIQMPKMDGYEASTILRSQGYDGPIIAVTAGAMPEERERCAQAGMEGFLAKPFHKEELRAILKRFLPEAPSAARGASDNAAALEGSQALQGGRGMPQDDEILAYGELVDSFMGKEDTVRRILSDFAPRLSSDLARLKDMLASGELAEAAKLCHGLKGAALTLCAREVGLAAQAMERLLKEGKAEAAANALLQLGTYAGRLIERIWGIEGVQAPNPPTAP